MSKDQCKNRVTLILLVAIVLALAGSAIYSFYDINGKSTDFTDREFRLVVTGSMDNGETENPISTIPVNSLVMIRHIDQSELDTIKIGDVIAYDRGGNMIVHRVIDIRSDGYFITKGDANASADSPVAPENVVGVIVGVSPILGQIVTLAREKAVWIILFIACAILVIYSVREIIHIYTQEEDEKDDERVP